jgi:aspartate aminotransferase
MVVTAFRRSDRLAAAIAPFLGFFNGPYSELVPDPTVANFAVGNPQELAMPSYVDAIRAHLEPQNKDWFAYKMSEPNAQRTVARTMSAITGLEWDPEDVNMTNGGFAALAVAFRTLLESGDEAIFLSPPWFFYEQLIIAADATPVRVKFDMPHCRLDLARIEQAITPRTRLVVINSPHNPSGQIFSRNELEGLAALLTSASQRHGHPIYIVSDEPYRRIVFDNAEFHSPAEVYPHTVVCYSYGKQLLAPGMRIGYLTWSREMPGRERLREDTFVNQCAGGYLFPNALLQHSIEDLEPLCVDIGALEQRREQLVGALREQGYETSWPQGTFYVMARSPIPDDQEFARILNRHKVLILPGTIVETPGWFRISLTASDDMVERGIPAFGAAMAEATASARTVGASATP